MTEYNWDDIITNPSSEKAKNCIGKRVYYSELPQCCLGSAICHERYSSGILIKIDEGG